MPFISHDDPAVAALIEKERERQDSTLNLIAAENTAPAAVLEALGASFNNKTAEGYPGRRYHTGCRVTDELEQLAVERAKALFEAGHANVQPHSGVNANLHGWKSMKCRSDPELPAIEPLILNPVRCFPRLSQ